MPQILSNNKFVIHIDLPREGYRSARFDWTGKITEVLWKNIPLTGTEKNDGADGYLFGKGLYNEFGIDRALGFEEVEIGDWFHKIGIGLLKKTDHQYLFSKDYEIKAADFEIKAKEDQLILHCRATYNGYAYCLTKEVELHSDSFTINYRLENQGEKVIQTSEYVHNFMAINDDPIGPTYSLRFPFQIQPEAFGEYVNPEQAVEIGQDRIDFYKTPSEPFFFSKLGGKQVVEASWELSNHQQQLRIREQGSFPCKQVNLWGCGHVISPELFVELYIEPGESVEWSRRYEVYEMD